MSISRHEPGSRLAFVVLICSAALLLPLAWPLMQGRVFVYNDLAWFHLPFRHLYQQALEKGDSLLWTPAIFSGVYFHGEGQTGVFHPLHLLLYRVFPLQAAFNLELLANYVAAFAGTWWFLRRLRFGTEPALFGAMLFAFSGFVLLHHHHVNMVAVVAHLPWLLGAADVLIVEDARRPRRLAFAAVALILGSAFLIGFPQALWWDAIALAAFAALRAGERRRWRRLLTLAAAVAIGVILGGIQILPSADAVAHSDRAGRDRRIRAHLFAAPAEPAPAVVAPGPHPRRTQRRRLHVVPRVRHLFGRRAAGGAGLGLDTMGGAERPPDPDHRRHRVRGAHAGARPRSLRRAGRSCSRTCRSSARCGRRRATWS